MKVNLIIVVSEFYESRKMSELAFRKIVWVCLFGLFMVMAWYLYYHRIPNIQTRTARERARDSRRVHRFLADSSSYFVLFFMIYLLEIDNIILYLL